MKIIFIISIILQILIEGKLIIDGAYLAAIVALGVYAFVFMFLQKYA